MHAETRFIARYSETDQMGIIHHQTMPYGLKLDERTF